VITLVVAWQSVGLARRDLAFTRSATEVSFWGRGDYRPDEATRIRTGRELEELLAQVPGHPAYLGLAANYYAWQGYWAGASMAGPDFARRAVEAQYRAQQSRPAYRQGWEKMIGYASRAGVADSWRTLAQRRLVQLRTGVDKPREYLLKPDAK
jgi:hypothetical protein